MCFNLLGIEEKVLCTFSSIPNKLKHTLLLAAHISFFRANLDLVGAIIVIGGGPLALEKPYQNRYGSSKAFQTL
jgi:hypothetical protein